MVIAKTASRNIAVKAGKVSEVVVDTQASFVPPEARGQEASSEHESTTTLSVTLTCTCTFLIMKHEAAQS